MSRKYLLGATKNNEIVLCEFEIRHWNGFPEFVAMFYTVRPFRENDIDLEDYFCGWLDGLGKEIAYDYCYQYHCAPQDLPKQMADECYDVRDALDCSLYPELIEVNDEYWAFESGSCGQYDTREEMMIYTDKEAYDVLHELWDIHHLKRVDGMVMQSVELIRERLSQVNEEEWIKNYIEEYLE